MNRLIKLLAKVFSVLLVAVGLTGCTNDTTDIPNTPTVEPNTPSVDVEINVPSETPNENDGEVIIGNETLEEHIRNHFKVHSTPIEFDMLPPLEDLIVRNSIYFGYDGEYEITKIVLRVSYYDNQFTKLTDKYTKEDYIEVTALSINDVINMVGFCNEATAFAAPNVVSITIADGRTAYFN